MYSEVNHRIEKAINALQNGKSVIIIDDKDRENEGDLIFAADKATPELVNQMIKYGSGIVCLAMTPKHAKQVQLEYMVPQSSNNSKYQTPFTVTIEAKEGVTTGVSAKDRAHTIRVASNSNAQPHDISQPGHIFPLIANQYGVLARRGHTEGSVDLVKMAQPNSCAVLCELVNEDGSMMKGDQILKFSKRHDIPVLSIEDIRQYRVNNEVYIELQSSAVIPLKNRNNFKMSVYRDPVSNQDIVVMSRQYKGTPNVRIHSSCITGDLFGSVKCDCQSQLHHALDVVDENGGILIYLDQEGRGIGLANKLKAYHLQDVKNLDTEQANIALDLPVDNRNYDLAVQVLKHQCVTECSLLSNNPDKLFALIKAGINATSVETISALHAKNINYLKTKKEKFNHNIQGV